MARGEIVEAATYKIIAAFVSLVLFYSTVGIVGWKYFGGNFALMSIILLPLSGTHSKASSNKKTEGWAAAKVRPIGTSTAFISRILKIVPNDLQKERQQLKAEIMKGRIYVSE